MKTKQLLGLIATSYLSMSMSILADESTIPSIPVGVLTANPTVVQTGTKPTLNWKILFPSNVGNVIDIKPPGTIFSSKSTYITIQIIGSRVIDSTSSNLATEARVSLNGEAYQQLFYGTQEDIDPSSLLYTKKLSPNDTIDLGGRFVDENSWSPFFTTKSSDLRVITLVNGQALPSKTINNFLEPYVDASGKVNIGPMSVIVLMELGGSDNVTPIRDQQDQVLLITFSEKHPNNGHGNNLDGVDASNPGNGHGGPNGEVDPSGGVDDEQ